MGGLAHPRRNRCSTRSEVPGSELTVPGFPGLQYPEPLLLQAAPAAGSAPQPLRIPATTTRAGARLYTQFAAIDLR